MSSYIDFAESHIIIDYLIFYLAGLADLFENADCFPYEEIPHFPVSTVNGHKSKLLFGVYENVEVLVMQGRFHAYEGYPLEQVRFCV